MAREGDGCGGQQDEGTLAMKVMGNSLLWHQIAAQLPLGKRASCVLVCRELDAVVVGDEPSYSVSRLCNVLAGHVKRLCGDKGSKFMADSHDTEIEGLVQLFGGTVEDQEELRRSLKPFLCRLCRREWNTVFLPWRLGPSRVPESAEALWQLMLLEPNQSFLCTRARGTRVDTNDLEAMETLVIGWTPLHLAAAKGDADGVRTLLVEGSDWWDVEKTSMPSPLHLAACSSVECVTELWGWRKEQGGWLKVEDVLVTTLDETGATALMYASMHGNFECAEYLIEKGGKRLIEAADKEGSTALMVASAFHQIEIVKLLIERGGDAQIRKQSKYGDTALMVACQGGHFEIVKLLIERMGDARASHALIRNRVRGWSCSECRVRMFRDDGGDDEKFHDQLPSSKALCCMVRYCRKGRGEKRVSATLVCA